MTPTETSCCDSLNGAEHANNFWNNAFAHHPNGPTPYRCVNAPGKQMNTSSLAVSSYYREMNDFLFLMAHGGDHFMNIWNADGTPDGPYPITSWLFGTDYTRWVYFQSCDVMHASDNDLNSPNWWDLWDYAFRGAQACIGYGSIIHPYNAWVNAAGDFWEKWAGSTQMGIWQAHRQSVYDQVYNTGYNCKPAVMSSKHPNAPPCCPHYYINDTYNAATSESGTHYAELYQHADLVH
jgi:hypothetical protein